MLGPMIVIIAVIVSYLAYEALGPISYQFELWHLAVIPVAILALLLARGMYLIGEGTDVEFDARQKAADSNVVATGFGLLDLLRSADLPVLGEGRNSEVYRCPSCRHTWEHTGMSGWPDCPNCGHEKTESLD